MPSGSPKKGGKKNRKYGRNEEKCKRYKASHKREINKIKRVLKSSGKNAAKDYAEKHNLKSYLAEIVSK